MSGRHDIRGIDHDAGYVLDEEFEELSAGSSDGEDELDVLLHGTPNQKRRLIRQTLSGDEGGDSSDSEDDFEKQMNKELDEGMTSKETAMFKMYEQQQTDRASASATGGQGSGQGSTTGQKTAATSKTAQQTTEDEFYDDIYFDSDEDSDSEQVPDVGHGAKGHEVNLGSDGQGRAQSDVTDESSDNEALGPDGKGKKRRKKHRVMTNDELFYDPDMDAEDEKWMTRQREKYRAINYQKTSSGAGPSTGKVQPAPNSDAILNCPACMTTLCIDCQRHELYQTQYRAMFVLNCSIVRDERLRYPNQGKKNRGKKKQKKGVERLEAAEPGAEGEDIYHPVKCAVCTTEVAVYDQEEIFHFFNVLASHS